jgi:hypothetical protein
MYTTTASVAAAAGPSSQAQSAKLAADPKLRQDFFGQEWLASLHFSHQVLASLEEC